MVLLTRVLAAICVAIVALLPFHALLTTWAGSNFGALDVWRIWKELLLTLMVPPALYLAAKTPVYRHWLLHGWLPWLIFGYIGLHLTLGVVALVSGGVNGPALLYALFANLRFLVFFLLIALLIVRYADLRGRLLRVVAAGAGLVLLFGLLQITVLPPTFLEHFGYGPTTIPAVQTVDNKLSYQRIQSTLRGANPLGAYIVLLVGLAAGWVLAQRRLSWRVIPLGAVLAICLWFTYSRSAYIGAVVAAAAAVLLVANATARRLLVIAALVTAILFGGLVYALRDNDVVQNSLFHSDEHSRSATSSNFDRLSALQRGAKDLAAHPLGGGPGTAGPASTRNDKPAKIAENYYLQIGQETGWLGLGLFVGINAVVATALWRARQDWLAAGLLAGLVGISAVNILSHAWVDDTLGLLWWGLAGIAYGSVILTSSKKRKQHAVSTA